VTYAADARFMALALSLGRRGLGRVWPWPSVGCVIVKDGRIVGRGVSDRVTMRHAEVVALDQAGDAARGATVYVTLEPCAHHGTTPPCADALVRACVARVVSACDDPNPLVAGKGFAILHDAGIAVETGVLADAGAEAHAGFLKAQTQGLPFVTLKLALSVDGRIATVTGDSQWITGPEARRVVHAMRARHDAVLVGGGTARADDPSLDVRGLGVQHRTVRVVASQGLDLPRDSKLMRSSDRLPVWLMHGAAADPEPWRAAGAETFECREDDSGLDPRDVLERLAKAGITRVFCEGGGQLAASLLRSGLVDELVVFTGGVALGHDGRSGLASLGLERLADAPRFALHDSRPIGNDMLQVWRPV